MEAIEQEKVQFMEMNKAICDAVGMSEMWSSTKELVSASFDKGAQVAEKIARADERAKCVSIAQDAMCSVCTSKDVCKTYEWKTLGTCSQYNAIEKALKGGAV